MMNPQIMQILSLAQNGGNPMAMLQQMFGNNPALSSAFRMANGKSPQQIQEVIRNIAHQRGMSDEQLNQFINQFGLKL